MIAKQFFGFLLRVIVSGVGMWVCISLFGSTDNNSWAAFAVAGLIFALVNAIVKPFATLFSLPLIFLTMGLFTIIVNALMVALTVWLMPGMHMDFIGTIFSCITMSIINYLVNLIIPAYNKR